MWPFHKKSNWGFIFIWGPIENPRSNITNVTSHKWVLQDWPCPLQYLYCEQAGTHNNHIFWPNMTCSQNVKGVMTYKVGNMSYIKVMSKVIYQKVLAMLWILFWRNGLECTRLYNIHAQYATYENSFVFRIMWLLKIVMDRNKHICFYEFQANARVAPLHVLQYLFQNKSKILYSSVFWLCQTIWKSALRRLSSNTLKFSSCIFLSSYYRTLGIFRIYHSFGYSGVSHIKFTGTSLQ